MQWLIQATNYFLLAQNSFSWYCQSCRTNIQASFPQVCVSLNVCICDLSSNSLWFPVHNFIIMSIFLNLRRRLQNTVKSVFHSLGFPKPHTHLSYFIFLSICGFEVVVPEILTLGVRSRAKPKACLEGIPKSSLVPDTQMDTWSLIYIKRHVNKVGCSGKKCCMINTVEWKLGGKPPKYPHKYLVDFLNQSALLNLWPVGC